MVNEEPYQGLKFSQKAARNGGPLSRTVRTGAARLSSVRAVRRSLNWGNERNPYLVLFVSPGTAPAKARKSEQNPNSKIQIPNE